MVEYFTNRKHVGGNYEIAVASELCGHIRHCFIPLLLFFGQSFKYFILDQDPTRLRFIPLNQIHVLNIFKLSVGNILQLISPEVLAPSSNTE